MERKLIEWHPLCANLFQVCTTKLELYEVYVQDGGKNREVRRLDSIEGFHDKAITCMEFYPHQLTSTDSTHFRVMTCVGNIAGSIFLSDWMKPKEAPIESSSRVACTGVSWNKLNEAQLVAGFDKLRK